MRQVVRAENDGDLTSFVDGLRRESWLLSYACVKFQVGLIERTAVTLRDRPAFSIAAFLDLDPAVVHSKPAPPPSSGLSFDGTSRAIEFTRSHMRRAHLLPMLLQIWPTRLTICHTQPEMGTSHA